MIQIRALAANVLAIVLAIIPSKADELSIAVRMENPVAFAAAIKNVASINSVDPTGRTALFYAVVTRKLAVVKSLIDAGAKVSIPGQIREPLWAAVVNGDTEIVSLLLSHGADSEAGIPGWRPVDAAVMSGRVNVLKLLIAAKPNMALPDDIPAESSGLNAKFDHQPYYSNKRGTVGDALCARHLEMATFLVNHGLPRNRPTDLKYLLRDATSFQPSIPEALIKGLLLAGANPHDATIRPFEDRLYPLTSAEVAARMGRAPLLDRYLIGARPDARYPSRLLAIASLSGDPATIEVVRKCMPSAKPLELKRQDKISGFLSGPEFDPRTSWDTREAGAMLLAPRGTKVPEVDTATEGASIAVITGKDSANEATLLAAGLSNIKGWTVVERDELEALLAERHFNIQQPQGLVEIGDKLKADFLIMLDKPGDGNDRVLSAEIVNVATGMVVKRLHAATKDFSPDAWVQTLRSSISRAQEDRKIAKGKMQAITLLGVGTIPGMTGDNTARSIVSAGLMAEIDATPGCITLTRMQMRPLVEEQTLDHPGMIWQSAWTLEAGVAREAEGEMSLTLRLKNLRSGESFDANGKGSPSHMADLVGNVWATLSNKAQFSKPRLVPADEAKVEGEALLKEAEWRLKKGEYDAAASLADAAHYLGNDGPATQSLRISARVSAIPIRTSEEVDSLLPERVAEILARLPTAIEALDLVNEHYDAVVRAAIDEEREVLKKGGNNIGRLSRWFSKLALCRAAIPLTGATVEEKEIAMRLDLGLQQWYAKVSPQASAEDKAYKRAFFQDDLLSFTLPNINLNSLPWLVELVATHLAKAFVIETSPDGRSNAANDMRTLIELVALQNVYTDPLGRSLPKIDVRKQLFAQLEGLSPPLLARLRKEADFLVAMDSSRAELADEIARMKVAGVRQGENILVTMVPDQLLCRYRVIENQTAVLLPSVEEMICLDALNTPGADGEMLRNLRGFSRWRVNLPNRKQVIATLSYEVKAAAAMEARPGITGIRGRASTAARFAKLTEPELAALLAPLPLDLKPDTKLKQPNDEAIKLLTPLVSLPAGAESFIVGRVVTQPASDCIWWSGGLVKGKFSFEASPKQCLPALARVSLTDGQIKFVISPAGWGDWKDHSDKYINPTESVVHASAGRVVWHIPKTGVFEVNPTTLELVPLIPKIDGLPESVTYAANAGAIIGDAFFVAEQGKLQDDEAYGSQRVLCLRPGKKPVVVVETSRRPEASPLDGITNRISTVGTAGDKIHIFANTDWVNLPIGAIMVEFSAGDAPAPLAILKDLKEIKRNLWHARVAKDPYAADVSKWTWGGGFNTGSSMTHGSLVVKKGSEIHTVPLDFPSLPTAGGSFHIAETGADGRPTGKDLDMTTSELISSGRGYIQIIGEQGDSLLVMQRFGGSGGMTPLVWRIAKSYLENPDSK